MTRLDDKADSHFANYLLIIFAGLFVFSPCLFHFFVSDDFIWIKRGADLSLESLLPGIDNSTYNIFRPLIPALFFVLHRIFGLSPFGYHLTSILFHVLNGLLFYHILSHFPLGKNSIVLASVIFVSHFAHEETIFWISSISVPLCCLFFLSSILTFLKWLRNGRIWFYLLSLGSGVLAFLIREDALALPLFLSFIIWLKYFAVVSKIQNDSGHKKKVAAITSLVPFFLLIVFYLNLRTIGSPHLGVGSLFSLNPANLLKNALYFSANLLVPLRLIFDIIGYRYSVMINSGLKNIGSNLTIVIVASFGIVFLISLLFVWIKKANKVLRVLGVTFLITLFPYLFFKGYGLRFTYFPAIGFSLIGSYLLLSVLKTVDQRKRYSPKSFVYPVMITILVFNFLILFERHLWWKRAGKTCEATITKAGAVLSSLPVDATVYFMNLPFRSHGAYILNNGFPEAMSLFYPVFSHQINTVESLKPPEMKESTSYHLFKYDNGEFLRVF